MNKYIKLLIVGTVLLVVSHASAFSKIRPGDYTIAIKPATCEILTEPTITKRAICAAIMGSGNVTADFSVYQYTASIGGNWQPSSYRWLGISYKGTGSTMGITTISSLLPSGVTKDGVIEEEIYLSGSGSPDVYAAYSIHWW